MGCLNIVLFDYFERVILANGNMMSMFLAIEEILNHPLISSDDFFVWSWLPTRLDNEQLAAVIKAIDRLPASFTFDMRLSASNRWDKKKFTQADLFWLSYLVELFMINDFTFEALRVKYQKDEPAGIIVGMSDEETEVLSSIIRSKADQLNAKLRKLG